MALAEVRKKKVGRRTTQRQRVGQNLVRLWGFQTPPDITSMELAESPSFLLLGFFEAVGADEPITLPPLPREL